MQLEDLCMEMAVCGHIFLLEKIQEMHLRWAGWAAAPYFDFLKGVTNELARTHLQGVEPRTDTNLGPKGRLADMVRHVTLASFHADPHSDCLNPAAANANERN